MRRGRALMLLASVAVGIGAAHGAGPDLSAFIGTWTFQADSQVMVDCGGGSLPETLVGTPISIYPGKTGDLTFDMGCGCTIDLSVDASGTRASSVNAQTCTVYPNGYTLTGTVSKLEIDLSAPSPTINFHGIDAQVTAAMLHCSSATFDGAGALARTSAGIVNCGADDDAVGVIAASAGGTTDCPLGAGRELFQVLMHDEDTDGSACSHQTGAQGEGSWVLPDDNRERALTCVSNVTTLNFCRVDGARFKPLTTVASVAQSYAVLKLGKTCPNGGVEVSKSIDNEDNPPGPVQNSFIGRPGPNASKAPPVGTNTTLFFCYYRTAPSPDGVMTAFPDLGFPYAVFHSFTGEQPPWVIAKRCQYSNDEDGQMGTNQYQGPDTATKTEFEKWVIENPGLTNTYFNTARVR